MGIEAEVNMDTPRDLVFFLLFVAMAFGLPTITGCCANYGTVYVSHPQVFTRERLVVARERELQFLSKALDNPPPSTYQGAIDTRVLNAFQNSFAATVSSTAGTSSPATASPPALTDAGALMPGGAGTINTASNVGLSSEDQFKDMEAYRETVNDVIREEELDDNHDRDGKTLYTLKFDTALIPGDDTTRPALVSLSINQPPLATAEADKVYRKWIHQLNTRRDEDENAMDMRFYRGEISSADESLINYLNDGLIDYCNQAKLQIDGTNAQSWVSYGQKAAQKTVDILLETPTQRLKDIQMYVTNSDASNRDLLFTGMELALNGKYCHDFAGLASVVYDFVEYAVSDGVGTCHMESYKPSIDPESIWWKQSEWSLSPPTNGLIQFTNILDEWSANSSYVDSIDPQMYAQNISDVSSQVSLQQLALAVNAAIAKPASLSETMVLTHQSEQLLQAIKRTPLAMGFANGTNFGWFLGPAFGIKDGNATFTQVPTRQSFSVSIVVPAWIGHLTITGTRAWIDSDGKFGGSQILSTNDVALPGDMDALISAIQGRTERPAPVVDLSGQNLQVTTNEQTLLIRGNELWRNPAVFIGSTPAYTVDLLPDMRGLLAHFKTISPGNEGKADLTVVTSFGADSLDNAITIASPSASVTNIPPSAKLISSFAANSTVPNAQQLVFSLTAIPAAFAGFSTNIYIGDGPGKWQALADSDYKLDSNRTSVTIPVSIVTVPPTVAPTTYKVDLGLRLTPTATPSSLFGGSNQPSFLYFPVKDQEKPVVTSVTVDYTAGVTQPPIQMSPAPNVTKANLYQAYPGLQQSLTTATAVLILTNTVTAAQSKGLTLQDAAGTGWTVPTAGLSGTQLPATTYDSSLLQYKTSSGGFATIPCSGGPVIVKGH